MPTLLAGPGGMPWGLGLNEGLGVFSLTVMLGLFASLAYPRVSLSLVLSRGVAGLIFIGTKI